METTHKKPLKKSKVAGVLIILSLIMTLVFISEIINISQNGLYSSRFITTFVLDDNIQGKSNLYKKGYIDGKVVNKLGSGIAGKWVKNTFEPAKYRDTDDQLNYLRGYRDGFAEN